MPKTEEYTLKVGEGGKERLTLLDKIYGHATHQFLIESGLKPGMTVLDVGCGTGNVSIWFAQYVGERGRVVAIDFSEEQLKIAKQNAQNNNVNNIDFIALSIYDLKRLEEKFDLVFSRFLLMHLADPISALKNMYESLTPGGLFVCDEPDIISTLCYPKSEAFDLSSELFIELSKLKKVDYNVGQKLFSLFYKFNLKKTNMKIFQPALINKESKQLWLMLFKEEKEELLLHQLLSKENYKQIESELLDVVKDQNSFILPVRNYQISGIKT